MMNPRNGERKCVRPALCLIVSLSAGWIDVHAEGEPKPADREPVVEGQIFDNQGAGVADVAVQLFATDAPAGSDPIASTTTNAYGDFALRRDGSLTGAHVVVFTKKGYARTQRAVDIVPGQPPPFVDLILPGGTKLRGNVVSAATGQPVAGARVRVDASGRDWNAVTGADGSFVLEQVVPGSGAATVKANGFARHREAFESLDMSEPMHIELGPERRCRIVVKDWRGQPIANVRVECLDDYLKDRWSGTTDARGAVALHGLSPEAASLRVRLTHANYVSDGWYDRNVELPEAATDSTHTLTLLAAGSVTGKIVEAESRRPLYGVRVTIGADLNKPQPRGWTDMDGAYTVAGVPPGKTIVTTYLRGYAPELQRTTVKPNEAAAVDLAMSPSKEAAGVVVDEAGQPLPGAYVFATRWRGHSTLGIQALTDDEGRFGFDTVPNDSFLVAIQAAGYEPLDDQSITPGKLDHRFEMTRSAPGPAGPAPGPKVGEAFPDVALVTLEGQPLKIADLAGRFVLVDFWATWCGPCVQEMPELVRLYGDFGKRDDFAMINVSIDFDGSEKDVRRFVKKKKMAWTNVFGSKSGAQKLAEACGVSYVPRKFLIGPDGKVLLADLGGPTMKETIAKHLKSADQKSKVKSRKPKTEH